MFPVSDVTSDVWKFSNLAPISLRIEPYFAQKSRKKSFFPVFWPTHSKITKILERILLPLTNPTSDFVYGLGKISKTTLIFRQNLSFHPPKSAKIIKCHFSRCCDRLIFPLKFTTTRTVKTAHIVNTELFEIMTDHKSEISRNKKQVFRGSDRVKECLGRCFLHRLASKYT